MLKKELDGCRPHNRVTVGTQFTISLIRNKPLANYGCVTGKEKSKGEEEEKGSECGRCQRRLERIGGKSSGRGA